MSNALERARTIGLGLTACLLLGSAGTFCVWRRKLFTNPTFTVVLADVVAATTVWVLVPYALGSREALAETAQRIGGRRPILARIASSIALIFVFGLLLTLSLLHSEVNALLRSAGVVGVVGVGIHSLLYRAPRQPGE